MSIQRVALSDIVANRYRKIDTYRISEEKIAALVQSYENSGFWDGSLQARPHPTRAGKFEIAFGHHRITAAKRHKLTEVGLVVAKRSDADMLRMMADENREEFKGDHLVAIETVAATIEAFGRGEIDLPAVDPKTPKGHVYLAAGAARYTCATVARFLSWTQRHGDADPQPTRACRLAFEAYHERANIVPALTRLPEDQRTRQATTAVLGAVKSARAAATRANQSPRQVEAAAHRAARDTVNRLRDGHFATKIRDEAAKIGRTAARVERTLPEITAFVDQRTAGLKTRVINLEVEIDALLNDVLPYRDEIERATLDRLVEVLGFADDRISGLFQKWIVRFTQRTARDITPRRRLLKG